MRPRSYATLQSGALADFRQFQQMMLTVFYPMNHDFLRDHNGAKVDHYWANWDLANMDSMLAIGVLADRREIYNEAIGYFRHGAGNGAIDHLVWEIYQVALAKSRKVAAIRSDNARYRSGRSLRQTAWNQGDDLFGYDDNRVLRGAEYVAQYNLGHDVPFTSYTNSDVTQSRISDKARGETRPIWNRFITTMSC